MAPQRGRAVSANLDETSPEAESPSDGCVDWSALEARYAHNLEFLPKLLTAVLESNPDQSTLLRHAAGSGDWAQVAFIAHRLKGTAGNLFAHGFHRLAVTTEESARAQRTETARAAHQLADALDELLQEIRQSRWLRDEPPSAPTPRGADPEALSEVLRRLESLLTEDDTTANDTYDRHQSLLILAFGDRARQLGAEIKRFDYQSALDRLHNLTDPPPSP